MYKLSVFDGNIKLEHLESNFMTSLLIKANSYFGSRDMHNVPLPYLAKVNQRGQIVRLQLTCKPHDPWWQEHHPLINPTRSELSIKIQWFAIPREHSSGEAERFLLPKNLNVPDGRAWVAIHNCHVVDLVHMAQVPVGVEFEEFRIVVRRELASKGQVLAGIIRQNVFYSKRARSG